MDDLLFSLLWAKDSLDQLVLKAFTKLIALEEKKSKVGERWVYFTKRKRTNLL